ncbi:hypothetical protein Tdes44962_MAKER08083 [Teratosphaeria destructans]|uniref:Uncharacterized protein n=1 Tax=Teratosphaeria destructans TaxID=418781 RepID=A0A9W7SXW6_9PEZI|nr:hypothetical protein Tdes44962_MAKER08083 [Teratosphaeria destructans]
MALKQSLKTPGRACRTRSVDPQTLAGHHISDILTGAKVIYGLTLDEILNDKQPHFDDDQLQRVRRYFDNGGTNGPVLDLARPFTASHVNVIAHDLGLFSGYDVLDFKLLIALCRAMVNAAVAVNHGHMLRWMETTNWPEFSTGIATQVLERNRPNAKEDTTPDLVAAAPNTVASLGWEQPASNDGDDILAPPHLLGQAQKYTALLPATNVSMARLVQELQRSLARVKGS